MDLAPASVGRKQGPRCVRCLSGGMAVRPVLWLGGDTLAEGKAPDGTRMTLPLVEVQAPFVKSVEARVAS